VAASSNIRPTQFEHDNNHFVTMSGINSVLFDQVDQQQPGTREKFWKTIDDIIDIEQCMPLSLLPCESA